LALKATSGLQLAESVVADAAPDVLIRSVSRWTLDRRHDAIALAEHDEALRKG
jgi:hypothetical protein